MASRREGGREEKRGERLGGKVAAGAWWVSVDWTVQ